jgi:hypothetical protein
MGKKKVRRKIIVQVRQSKGSKQKTVTIPKSAQNIKKGDYLVIRRLSKR